jgi:hypothetical protein
VSFEKKLEKEMPRSAAANRKRRGSILTGTKSNVRESKRSKASVQKSRSKTQNRAQSSEDDVEMEPEWLRELEMLDVPKQEESKRKDHKDSDLSDLIERLSKLSIEKPTKSSRSNRATVQSITRNEKQALFDEYRILLLQKEHIENRLRILGERIKHL